MPRTLCDESQSPIDCSRISLEHCFDAPVGKVLYPPGKPQFFGASPRGLAEPDTLDAARNKDVNALATHASVAPEAIAARSDEFRARVLVESRSTFLSIGFAGRDFRARSQSADSSSARRLAGMREIQRTVGRRLDRVFAVDA